MQLKTADVESMQKRLTALRLYGDKIDGKAGMKTRAALGAYQKANGLAVDCWPTVRGARPHARAALAPQGKAAAIRMHAGLLLVLSVA